MEITEALERREVEYVERDDDGGVTIVCKDGRSVSLFVDSNQTIQMRGVGVTIKVYNPIVYPSGI